MNPSVYKSILKVRSARVFDVAGFCMRFYGYMMNIGTVSMLTLAGYSFLTAGFVSSIIAFAVFIVSPRIGKLVDEYGQHRVLPVAALITLAGLASMLVTVHLHGPVPMLYISAVPMGFLPSAQAMVRSRWTYLIRSGRLGKDAPDIHAVFSYEGIIDDIGFMLGPPTAIAIATAVTPIAGLLTGGILFTLGVTVMTLSRSTEPIPGWTATKETSADAKAAAHAHSVDDASTHDEKTTPAGPPQERTKTNAAPPKAAHPRPRQKSIIREMPVVRVLFALMFLIGTFYGMFDTSGVAFAEEMSDPNIASVALMGSAVISIVVGFFFGMVHIRIAPYKQVVLFAVLIGCAYGPLMLVRDVPMFFVVSLVGALFYAPYLITMNSACERSVPGHRLTEAITWLNAGCTCGLAVGPSIAGILVETWSSIAGFVFGGGVALMVPLIALAFMRILRKHVKDAHYRPLGG